MSCRCCGDKARGGQKKGTRNILNLWLVAVMLSAACIPITLFRFGNNAEIHAIMADKLLQDVVHAKNVTIPSHQTNKQVEWSMFYHAAVNPIPAYTEHLAKEAVRPSSWQCSANKDLVHASSNSTIFGFVHVYKAAGTTIRQFFHEYAYTCHGTWISLGRCSGVLPSSIKSQGPWKPCDTQEVADGRTRKKVQYWYPKEPNFSRGRHGLSNGLLKKNVNIYGGHARLGTGDYIFGSSSPTGRVRYITFLRDPLDRLVSGVLYQNKVKGRHESLEQVVKKIKELIATERGKDRYWDKSLSYLLTPAQRVTNENLDIAQLRSMVHSDHDSNTTISSTAFAAEARSKVAIQNLYDYNVIIGFSEKISESLHILKHVLLKSGGELNHKAEEVFKKFGLTPSDSNMTNSSGAYRREKSYHVKVGVQANKSSKNEVSTSAVVAELAKDKKHMALCEEYLKYETLITDFAWSMHTLQYKASFD